MKNLFSNNNQPTHKTRVRFLLIVVAIVAMITAGLSIAGLMWLNNFFESHYFKFTAPIIMTFNKPITLETRKTPEPKIVQVVVNYPGSIDTPIKKYICEKFGVYNCNIALAVANAEGLNHPADGFNINDNGTIDVGIFRINSIHFNQPGCSLKEITDPYKNIDCAYKLWDASDTKHTAGDNMGSWLIWSSVDNGNYLKFLDK